MPRGARTVDETLEERVNALAREFLLDVVRLVRTASLGDIADAMSALERGHLARAALRRLSVERALAPRVERQKDAREVREPRPAARNSTNEAARDPARNVARSASRTAARNATRDASRDRQALESSPPAERSPFDITMPGPLLDGSAEITRPESSRELDPAPVSARRSRVESSLIALPAPQSEAAPERVAERPPESGAMPLVPDDGPSSEEKPPSIVLRQGEQLVRASRSGVVIRRVRGG